MSPGVVESFDWGLNHRAPLMFDAESIAADDLADLARRHSIVSRSIENAGKRRRRYRYDRAGAAFAEEGVFGRGTLIESDICAK